jgi:chromosome segregation ATPase
MNENEKVIKEKIEEFNKKIEEFNKKIEEFDKKIEEFNKKIAFIQQNKEELKKKRPKLTAQMQLEQFLEKVGVMSPIILARPSAMKQAEMIAAHRIFTNIMGDFNSVKEKLGDKLNSIDDGMMINVERLRDSLFTINPLNINVTKEVLNSLTDYSVEDLKRFSRELLDKKFIAKGTHQGHLKLIVDLEILIRKLQELPRNW